MDIFDFEELAAEILDVTDEQREDDDFLPTEFYKKFGIDFDTAYVFAQSLLPHTQIVNSGLQGKQYHAFLSKNGPFTLMKSEAI